MRIHVLAAVLSCAGLAGCAGSSSNTPPPTPPTPPSPTIAVTAPQNGSTVNGTPVTISITTKNVSDRSQLSVLLDGADITSQLSAPDANGVQSAQVSQPAVNYGKNQVQVRYQTTQANSTFTLNTASGGGLESGVSIGSELVAITTRVLKQGATGTNATDWGIQVGDGAPILSPTPKDQNGNDCTQQCYGYQIVLLSRQDLSLISNNAYEVANYDEIQPSALFIKTLSSLGQGNYDTPSVPNKQPAPTQCEPSGCIMVMQSLVQTGYNPCYNGTTNYSICPPFVEDTNAVGTLIYWLTKLGASADVLFANGLHPGNNYIGYSFIGNAGSGQMPGTGAIGARDGKGNIIVSNTPNTNGQFERLGCLKSRYQNSATICDNLGNGGSADNAGGSTDPQQAGRISGVFIRDNYNLFTFSQNAPQMSYTFGTTLSGGTYTNVVSINGSTTEGAGQYTMSGLPPGSGGGFRLLILNRTHPDWADAKQLDKYYNFSIDGLAALENDINNFPDANGLFFLASMGNISHDDTDPVFSPHWESFIDYIQPLGAEPMTVRILGDNHKAFNSDGKDDYLLVGKMTPYAPPVVEQFTAGTQAVTRSRYTAQESGYVINRHTVANATSPTQVEGVLVMDHQGYYTPHMQATARGLMVPQVTSLASASLLAPVAWPYTANSQEQGTYTWISLALCCMDIRASYINLNVSPEVWLTQLDQLTFPPANDANYQQYGNSFTPTDFANVKDQLAQEFAYVADARNLQNNILSLYQDQQSNVGLILDQAASDIKADLFSDTPPPTTPTPWSTFTSDVFPVLSNLAGFLPEGGNVAKTALGVGTLVVDNATDHSNDGSGVSQTMHALANEEVAEANLAQYAADQYADSLGTVGNDFKRVVTDWGRLKSVGAPIESGQLTWDPVATSMFLRAFDLTTRRQYYPLLMRDNSDFFVTHIRYGDTQYYGRDDHFKWGNDEGCDQSKFHEAQDNLTGYDDDGEDLRGTAWWPGLLQVSQGPSDDPHNPPAYWWDIWALGEGPGTNDHCPEPGQGPLPNTYGMFDPITIGDTTETNGLGLWKPYILQYGGWAHTYLDFNAYYGGSVTP